MLMQIANLWNELLMSSVVLYCIALLFLAITFILTKSKHLISGAIVALIAGFFGQVSKIAFKIGMILAVARMILIFI